MTNTGHLILSLTSWFPSAPPLTKQQLIQRIGSEASYQSTVTRWNTIYIHIFFSLNVYIYDWVTFLYSRNWQDIVNQVYLKKKKKKVISICSAPPNTTEHQHYPGGQEGFWPLSYQAKKNQFLKTKSSEYSHGYLFMTQALLPRSEPTETGPPGMMPQNLYFLSS